MTPLDAEKAQTMDGGGRQFSRADQLRRAFWMLAWLVLARWTPPQMHGWRRAVLRLFGARLGAGVRVYSSVAIWWPGNLEMGSDSWLGPRVRCYNQGKVTIGRRVVVSQDTQLCASSHDLNDYNFQLELRPITIEDHAWIAADAFIGPDVTVGKGAVLGARAVAMRDLEPWTIYSGNPAAPIRMREIRNAPAGALD